MLALALPAVIVPIVGAPGPVAATALLARTAPSNETSKNDARLSKTVGLRFIYYSLRLIDATPETGEFLIIKAESYKNILLMRKRSIVNKL